MNLNSIHNKPKNAKFLSYGTAGFRSNADNLSTFIMYRVGILAALRSYKCSSKTIGVMITASHNPPQDNGVKVVEPDGSMLTISWEKLAIELCNCDNDDLQNQINQIIVEQKIDVESVSSATNGGAKVIIGYDTRETSERFADAVIDGVNSFETALSINFNVLTTPQLHYLVVADNTSNEAFMNLSEHSISPIPFGDGVVPYGKFSEKGYYEKLSTAFEKLLKNRNSNVSDGVTVDCANGVGALKLAELNTYLARHFRQFNIENGEVKTYSKLNSGCGADFVKVKQRIPEIGNFSGKNKNFVSFDGDADRIVYFYNDDNEQFHLLDGDKIASLLAKQLNTWLSEAELNVNLGIIQTAYANGASTNFLKKEIGEKFLDCAKTGVKHCHHKALNYDIGVYFEANGHGTIIVNQQTMKKIYNSKHEKLINFVDLINQTVGDAISILLAVEVALAYNNWTVKEWDQMYTELPNRQCKVKVQDRTKIVTFDEERQVSSPEGLQEKINATVKKIDPESGRSFVRPSGTEDVVRVYAEACTREKCDEIAKAVASLVHSNAGGLGVFDENSLW